MSGLLRLCRAGEEGATDQQDQKSKMSKDRLDAVFFHKSKCNKTDWIELQATRRRM